MRITQWGEYGVHCSVYLAQQAFKGHNTVGAADIAKSQGIALEYAQQILQRLRKGGIVQSIRGPQGGYQLARTAAEITLKDILVAAEGDTFEIICENKPIDHDRCADSVSCGLRDLWYDLKSHVDVFLTGRTLEDLAIKMIPADQGPVQIGNRAA